MYAYVFITWLVANLLHPLAIIPFMTHGDVENAIGMMMFVLCFSFMFSIPCLPVAMLVIWIIDKAEFNVLTKFIIWLLIASAFPLSVIVLLFGSGDMHETIGIVITGTIATAAAILIRVKYFFKVFALMEAKKQKRIIE